MGSCQLVIWFCDWQLVSSGLPCQLMKGLRVAFSTQLDCHVSLCLVCDWHAVLSGLPCQLVIGLGPGLGRGLGRSVAVARQRPRQGLRLGFKVAWHGAKAVACAGA